MAKQFDAVRLVAAGQPKFGKREAYVAIPGLLDKVR
jgi:hypothetical protein